MTRADVAWLTLTVTAGVGFYVADRRGVAFCASTRRLFRTHRPAGRVALTASVAVGAVALERHLNKH